MSWRCRTGRRWLLSLEVAIAGLRQRLTRRCGSAHRQMSAQKDRGTWKYGTHPAQAIEMNCHIPKSLRLVATVAGFIRSGRSEEHTSELQSLMRISYAVFCLKKKKITKP